MNHQVRLFVGRARVLEPFVAASRLAAAFALTPRAEILVLPLDDDLHDALHRIYGTGEWRREPPLLSSGDMAFAAEASKAGPLAFIETSYFGSGGYQAAVTWQDGGVAFGPHVLKRSDQERRASALWPVNAALRLLGIEGTAEHDAFQAFGLGFYRSNEDVWSMAARIAVG